MKKFALLALLAAALAVPGVAAADTPQGKLTGSASYGVNLTIVTPIIDGGTSYVGLENDKSGNCDGDTGSVMFGSTTYSILCAHFVASSRDGSGPKMRFTFGIPVGPVTATPVYRISDGGPNLADDKLAYTPTGFPGNNIPLAEKWVNEGRVGAGWAIPWAFQTLVSGTGYTITASQT